MTFVISACSKGSPTSSLPPVGRPRSVMSGGALTIVQKVTGAQYSQQIKWQTPALTTAPAVGDVMVLAVAWETSVGSLTGPPDWTAIGTVTDDPTYHNSISLYCRVVQSGDTGQATFNSSDQTTSTSIEYEISGEDQSNPCDAFGGKNADAQTLSVTSATPTSSALPIAFFSSRVATSSSQLAPGWAEDATRSGGPYVEAQHGPMTSSAATASLTFNTPGYQVAGILMVESAPTATPPPHIQTAAYLWKGNAPNQDPASLAPYLTYAYPLYSHFEAVHNAGIQTIQYINPQQPQSGQQEYTYITTTYSSVQATDCNGKIVTTYSGAGLLADPNATQWVPYYNSVIDWYNTNKLGAQAPYADLWFIDNNGGWEASATPCNGDAGGTPYTQAAWGDAFSQHVASITGYKFLTNSLANTDTDVATYVNHYLSASNVLGGLYEGCFDDRQWSAEEDSQIYAVQLYYAEHRTPHFGPGWWCYVNEGKNFDPTAQASTMLAQRLYVIASFLLTYDPNYSTLQEGFSTCATCTGTNIPVMPEAQLVPMYPTISYSSLTNVSSLACGTVYCRAYGHCYYQQVDKGPCTVYVNPVTAASPQAIPTNSYHHAMALSGDDILDGGTVNFAASPPTTLNPGTAAILFN